MGLIMSGLLWAHFKQLVELKVKFLNVYDSLRASL